MPCRPAHAIDLGPESSIISLTIPLAARSPAIFHSMVSCSSIFLSRKQATWQQVAVRHHCEALRGLALEMSDGNLSEIAVAESSLAVIMMLHLFERFDSSSKTPTCAHLLAAQDIFLKACSTRLLETKLGALVLEAFVYRISINSPFHPELVKRYNTMETLTRLITNSRAMKRGDLASFRRSLWLGLPPDVYGSLYQVSYLLRMMPLDRKQRNDAMSLSQLLRALRSEGSPDSESGFDDDTSVGVGTLAARVRHLYLAAAELILWKILEPDLRATDNRVQRLLHETMADLSSSDGLSQHITPVVICPVVILGTAAVHCRDRDFLRSQLNRMQNLTGGRGLDSVLSFWQDSWSEIAETLDSGDGVPEFESSQLNVWFDDSRLRRVVL
ncbi:hypothetical protein H2204_003359 [Knufia peltigerae]|uniref:Uncharacterized protein n=1 Tax=Knufia peltigerae TaxID=1002370 RepID=A0AA38Y977_9EURO|nr:hypothetical protein H2204_003359 [Knufia peltigerae]